VYRLNTNDGVHRERERSCQMANKHRGNGDASQACSVCDHVHLISEEREDPCHAWLSFPYGIVPISVYILTSERLPDGIMSDVNLIPLTVPHI
jgi:hypothetical protein